MTDAARGAASQETARAIAQKAAEAMLVACDRHGPISPRYAATFIEDILTAALDAAHQAGREEAARRVLQGLERAEKRWCVVCGARIAAALRALGSAP